MCDQNTMEEQKLSIPMIIILGLAPGLVILFLLLVFTSPFFGIGFNMFLSLILAGFFGLVLTELGILKIIAWRENKTISGLILYKNKIPKLRFFLSTLIPFIILVLGFTVLPQYEMKLWKVFDFVPDWFRQDKVNFQEMKYLKITLIIGYFVNGFLGPLVEEIYFRGYLLPRMGVFGKFAPLVNSIIFSIYHFFTPWLNITRIIAVTPMVYSVWINKNMKIGIIVHCLGNSLGGIGIIMMLVG
jgi:membrane protease YdiL (CAAX protease family)